MTLEPPSLLVAMLRDTDGVAVVYGGETTYGHSEAEGEVVLGEMGGAGVIGSDPSVLLVAVDGNPVALDGTVFGTALTQDAEITVDGDNYTIRNHLPVEDGKLTRVWLKNA